jgi:hypothetical protein
MIKDQNRSEERKIPRDHPLRSKNNLDQKDFGANKHCGHQIQDSKRDHVDLMIYYRIESRIESKHNNKQIRSDLL